MRRSHWWSAVCAVLIAVSLNTILAAPARADACGVLGAGGSAAAHRAIVAACKQVGVNYAWGGGHEGLPGIAAEHPAGAGAAAAGDLRAAGGADPLGHAERLLPCL